MNTSLSPSKASWRRVLQARRLARRLPSDGAFRRQVDRAIAQNGASIVALYVPGRGEPDIGSVLDTPGSWLIPRLFTWEGTLLPIGSWGWGTEGLERPRPTWPAQPRTTAKESDLESVDMILVPALAVDRDGVRLGKGGGWYDRALESFPQGTRRFAVTFADEVYPAGTLPSEPHDLRVDGVITEHGWETF